MIPTRRVWVPAEWTMIHEMGSRWGKWVKLSDGYYKTELDTIDPRDIHDAVLPEVVGDYEAAEA